MIRLTGAQVTMLKEAHHRLAEKLRGRCGGFEEYTYGTHHRAWEEFIDETKYDLVKMLFPSLAGVGKPKVPGVPCMLPENVEFINEPRR